MEKYFSATQTTVMVNPSRIGITISLTDKLTKRPLVKVTEIDATIDGATDKAQVAFRVALAKIGFGEDEIDFYTDSAN